MFGSGSIRRIPEGGLHNEGQFKVFSIAGCKRDVLTYGDTGRRERIYADFSKTMNTAGSFINGHCRCVKACSVLPFALKRKAVAFKIYFNK